FRMRGHEEASGTKYVPKKLMEAWAKKDPLENFENYLVSEGHIDESYITDLRKQIKSEINHDLKLAQNEGPVESDVTTETRDVYAPCYDEWIHPSETKVSMRFIDAISDGLKCAMEKYPKTVFMGQDIADYGGVFKITEGFVEQFGSEKIRNTPLCESAILGIGLGVSMMGYKAMVEMQFADFVTCGFNQIVNNLAKIHYRWGHAADLVIRMPCGAGVGAGPFHSQTNEAWFTHTPGLKIVYPSNPVDAKGLLISSFEDPNPVLYFEHKALYRNLTDEVPEGYYNIPIGKGVYVKQGDQLSIITYGMGVHWATAACEKLGVSADIVDLRSLQPLDYNIIEETVKKTNKVILLHEDSMFGGIGGEISAYISEHLFEHLDGPIKRVASLDTPIPFANALEEKYLANYRLDDAITELIKY
ncbi:MAG: dehydrogenase, partial [Saprospiraceae bacterium]|nr:dehydrogenase [Saprospiraceae bacterium]